MTHKLIKTDNYLLVVSDDEIKEGDWLYSISSQLVVQANKGSTDIINSKVMSDVLYLKIISHLPLNGSPELEGVDLLPALEDDVEKLAEAFGNNIGDEEAENIAVSFGYKSGYNKAREKYKYTEEDIRKAIAFGGTKVAMKESLNSSDADDFIQSLHQYPTEFEVQVGVCSRWLAEECELGCCGKPEEIKTTTINGRRKWVCKYK